MQWHADLQLGGHRPVLTQRPHSPLRWTTQRVPSPPPPVRDCRWMPHRLPVWRVMPRSSGRLQFSVLLCLLRHRCQVRSRLAVCRCCRWGHHLPCRLSRYGGGEAGWLGRADRVRNDLGCVFHAVPVLCQLVRSDFQRLQRPLPERQRVRCWPSRCLVLWPQQTWGQQQGPQVRVQSSCMQAHRLARSVPQLFQQG